MARRKGLSLKTLLMVGGAATAGLVGWDLYSQGKLTAHAASMTGGGANGPGGRVMINGQPATDLGGVAVVWCGAAICQDKSAGGTNVYKSGVFLAGGKHYWWAGGNQFGVMN